MTFPNELAIDVAAFLERLSPHIARTTEQGQAEGYARRLRAAVATDTVAPLESAVIDDLATSEINHLRRLVGWVRTEVGQTPEELVATIKSIAPVFHGETPSEGAQQRLVEAHRRASDVPKYVRAAVKALTHVIGRETMASRLPKATAAAEVFDLSNSDLRLMAGEMTAGELRTTRAVLIGVKGRFLESMTPAAGAERLDAATLRRAIAVVRAECLNDPTDDPGDVGYNTAVQHCIEAIELLLAKTGEATTHNDEPVATA